MIKSLVAAAVLSLGLAGYAVAQETAPAAPAGTATATAEPMHHHHHHHHHHWHHHWHHHHMHSEAAPAAAPSACAISRTAARPLRFEFGETSSSPGKPLSGELFSQWRRPRSARRFDPEHHLSASSDARLRVLTSTRGPSASRTTAPHNVRTSCCVSSMRWKMLRRFRRIPGFWSPAGRSRSCRAFPRDNRRRR